MVFVVVAAAALNIFFCRLNQHLQTSKRNKNKKVKVFLKENSEKKIQTKKRSTTQIKKQKLSQKHSQEIREAQN